MHAGANIFKVCMGITCMFGRTFSGCAFVVHACKCRNVQRFYRYYMHVGADISRVRNGIICMSGPTFCLFVQVLFV